MRAAVEVSPNVPLSADITSLRIKDGSRSVALFHHLGPHWQTDVTLWRGHLPRPYELSVTPERFLNDLADLVTLDVPPVPRPSCRGNVPRSRNAPDCCSDGHGNTAHARRHLTPRQPTMCRAIVQNGCCNFLPHTTSPFADRHAARSKCIVPEIAEFGTARSGGCVVRA